MGLPLAYHWYSLPPFETKASPRSRYLALGGAKLKPEMHRPDPQLQERCGHWETRGSLWSSNVHHGEVRLSSVVGVSSHPSNQSYNWCCFLLLVMLVMLLRPLVVSLLRLLASSQFWQFGSSRCTRSTVLMCQLQVLPVVLFVAAEARRSEEKSAQSKSKARWKTTRQDTLKTMQQL